MLPLRNIKRFFYKALRQPLYAASVAAKRFRAYLAYLYGDGRAVLPESITIFLTHRCNLRCKMCGQWGEYGVTRKEGAEFAGEELSTEELRSFIDGVSAFKPNMTLFGGEPLLHAGAMDLMEHIKKRRLHCLVITNGFLVEESASRMVGCGLDELNVSLDGSREVHDGIRGMPGLFDKIMAGIKKVQEEKAREGKAHPLVNIQCTITRYNYRQLEGILDVARSCGADSLTLHNLIFLDGSVLERQAAFDRSLDCSSAEWKGFIFEPGIDVDILWNKIQLIYAGRGDLRVDLYPNFNYIELKDYYTNPGYAPRGFSGKCLSPWIAAYVFPDGAVRPCLNSTYSYGNIRAVRFQDIWNGRAAVRFRRQLKKCAAFPVCARCTELYRY